MGSVALWLTGCASLPDRIPRPETVAIAASADTELGHIAAVSASDGGDHFRPLASSDFSLNARIALANHASQSLDLQYYLIQNDFTGRTLLHAVRDAAVRGVRVRILVDDLYTASSDRMLVELAAYPNVEIHLFNPFPAGRSFTATRFLFSAFDFARVNHRMHNKLFIADGAFAVAGGRNIADEYFFHSAQGNFLDFDVLLDGPAVGKLENIFDQYWNSRWVYPLDAIESTSGDVTLRQAAFDRRLAQDKPLPAIPPDAIDVFSGFRALGADLAHPPLKMIEGKIRVVADSPEKVSGRSESGKDPSTVTAQVLDTFKAAHSSLLLVSPYFVPNEAALHELKEAGAHGVHVDVVTNSLAANDEPLAGAAYADYRKEMLKAGIGLYEISSKELKFVSRFRKELGSTTGRSHAKLAVIDRHVVFVGSMNLDLRSSRLNTEMGLLIDSEDFAAGVDDAIGFIQDQGCYRLILNAKGDIEWLGDVDDPGVVYTDDPQLDLGTKIQIFLTRPFVPDTLL